jgi:release factor glutamine methyltransferase
MTDKTIAISIREAATALADVSEAPRLDAELLAACALGITRGEMLMRANEIATPGDFASYIARRIAHEPVAYITGSQAFWDIELYVTPDVLIPRSDSETLIETAQVEFAGTSGPMRILDLGTGSGALLLAALSLFPNAQGIGADASKAALMVAAENARRLDTTHRAQFMRLSWLDANWHSALGAPFDLILCNPPYVETGAKLARQVREYEPHGALFAGSDGLDDYRILIPAIPKLLAPGGIAIFEIGYNQAAAVTYLAQRAHMTAKLTHDLSGNPRCLSMRTT